MRLRFALLTHIIDGIPRIVRIILPDILLILLILSQLVPPKKLAARMPPEPAGRMPAPHYGRTCTRYIVLAAAGVKRYDCVDPAARVHAVTGVQTSMLVELSTR